MKLQTISVDRLRPAPYNPRVPLTPGTPGYRRLERSLNEFSLVQPIVWNEQTGHVVAGHQRLEILKNQGVTELEVSVVSLPLEREKALNITLNNAQVGSDWDPAKLVELLSELNTLQDFDATLTGFDADDINDLLLGPALLSPDESQPESSPDIVHVTLEIAPAEWETVRPQLDLLVATHKLTVHVKLPS
jgi:ParB-like chromosome segregation protein Spo0J